MYACVCVCVCVSVLVCEVELWIQKIKSYAHNIKQNKCNNIIIYDWINASIKPDPKDYA